MSEEYLVKYGSPTLAGIKTGSLFMCPCESKAEIIESLSAYNRELLDKGLCMIPLNFLKDRVLIYMFRPKRLKKDLSSDAARAILKKAGYKSSSYGGYIAELRNKVINSSEFPHEIGLFLSYPPEDVTGFIENKASGYKLSGSWKVYGDAEKARKTFSLYNRCTKVYIRKLGEGRTLKELTVAG